MQTRLSSFIEQCLNVGSGFVISLVLWTYFVVPVWDIEVTMLDNLNITILFTLVSVLRGYLWRRFFNSRCKVLYKKL